jgi:hypothetical protein
VNQDKPELWYVVTTHPRNRLCYGLAEAEVQMLLLPQLALGEKIVGMRPAKPEDIAFVVGQGGSVPPTTTF